MTVGTSPAKHDGRPERQDGARETWAERVADRSPSVQRSRDRSVEQARSIVAAALRLIESKGPSFTTQELTKEAGIALQTFYRYFSSKDSLLLAVIEEIIAANCAAFAEQARHLADPVERLRYYVTVTVRGLDAPRSRPSFITSEHFRLQTQYPAEVSRATQPFTDLLVDEIRAAMATGRIHPHDPDYAAWLITQLTMAVFHHYDCAGVVEPIDQIAQRLWEFCFAAVNGPATGPPAARPRRANARTGSARAGRSTQLPSRRGGQV